ncbi:serine/threonine protein phosphatase [Colwellia sp. KU-HH00111]|uniref:metallophosphoesterase n=1 Tax=Colwellia sp. KU-HH00111 TaxID=3127652 RepID=UPI003107294A
MSTLYKAHRAVASNAKGIDYFVGDIHGNLSGLLVHLHSLGFNFSTDRLFACGDLINRGENSIGCLELLMQPWFFSVLGNHEEMFLRSFDEPAFYQALVKNGGEWIKALSHQPGKLMALAQLIRIKMPLTLSVSSKHGKVGVAHADSPQNWQAISLDNTCIHHCLWSRRNMNEKNKGIKIAQISFTVHGHNSVHSPVIINNQIWIDTLQFSGNFTILSTAQLAQLIV